LAKARQKANGVVSDQFSASSLNILASDNDDVVCIERGEEGETVVGNLEENHSLQLHPLLSTSHLKTSQNHFKDSLNMIMEISKIVSSMRSESDEVGDESGFVMIEEEKL